MVEAFHLLDKIYTKLCTLNILHSTQNDSKCNIYAKVFNTQRSIPFLLASFIHKIKFKVPLFLQCFTDLLQFIEHTYIISATTVFIALNTQDLQQVIIPHLYSYLQRRVCSCINYTLIISVK